MESLSGRTLGTSIAQEEGPQEKSYPKKYPVKVIIKFTLETGFWIRIRN
jgi:hypothetical protein